MHNSGWSTVLQESLPESREEYGRKRGDQRQMAKRTSGVANVPKTYGPVADLERHLPSDWWRTLFNSLYLKTDGDVMENALNTSRDVDMLIRSMGLDRNDHVLDLCCGQGRHCLELARRGFRHVTGLDRSRYLIRLARKRAAQANLEVVFREGDARKVRLPDESFHSVMIIGNSFGYFDREEDDVAVLQSVKRVLKSAGNLAMDFTDGEWIRSHFEARSWEWIDENHLVCRERSLSSDGERLVCRELVVHSEKGVIADQFYAERLYSRQRVVELLDRLGFTSIRFHDPLEIHSERDQDLGMMAHRVFLTASAPAKTPKVRKGAPLFRRVTVILGDPNLPDSVKKDGKFNPEDFDTVQRMKDALAELADYEFAYLDNHAAVLAELRANPPDFVFNLCDEGYKNDAFMELHIPAILELLNVPYTGAPPSCLGICYNKTLVRSLAASLDIPTPLETYFSPDDQAATLPSVLPALIKPNYGDSSLGITKDAVVYSPEEMITYLEELRDQLPGYPVLIQEFLPGREYSVGIIGNVGLTYRVLPPLEVDYKGLDPNLPKILGYESKWLPNSPYWNQIQYHEAETDEETQRKLYDYSNILFERLGCRDYARFDFRTDADGEIKLLEVNPNPGWCWDGKFNFMAGFDGLRYSDMLRLIIEAAQERIAAQRES